MREIPKCAFRVAVCTSPLDLGITFKWLRQWGYKNIHWKESFLRFTTSLVGAILGK